MKKNKKKTTKSTTRFPRLTLTTALVAAAILAIAAVTVVSRQKAAAAAGEAERSLQVVKKSKGNFVTVKVAGQDVEVDSQTGQLKELTPAEAQRLAAGLKKMVNQSTEGLEQVQHADGSVSMDLEDRFQNVTVARVNEDGSVSQSCVDNPQAAAKFFKIDPKLLEDQPNANQEKR